MSVLERLLLAAMAAAALGCGSGASPDRASTPEAVDPASLVAETPPTAPAALEPAPQEPAPPEPAPPEPAAADPIARETVTRGEDPCASDDDCVLTSYQSGCCVQACQSYARSRLELERVSRGEDCDAFFASGRPCPPPSPCPRPTHRAVSARCSEGMCATVLVPLPR